MYSYFGLTFTSTSFAKVLYLEKRHVTGPDVTITTIVDDHPVRAGIDPYNILIDRRPSDNVRAVVRH